MEKRKKITEDIDDGLEPVDTEKLRGAIPDRVRFRVREDKRSTITGIVCFLALIAAAGAFLIGISKSAGGKIAIASIMAAAFLFGIGAMIYYRIEAHRLNYAYFIRNGEDIFCMSVIGESATVYRNGTAYVINGKEFYTLDERGYIDFKDGEGTGLLSVLRANVEDTETYDNEYFIVRDRYGGGHDVDTADGKITRIASAVPYYTDETDPSSGQRKIRTRKFVKTDPTYEFELVVPEFVKKALENADGVFPSDID